MAKRLDVIVFVAVIAVAALLQSSVAQTSHTVGDALGWTIPPNGASDYSNWAAGKTFAVGDILVFNYTTGHDVARVNKEAFDACNGTSPISLQTDGPVNETIKEAGEHYYICTISTHCNLGQKLAINVSAATSPAPQPSTPPTAPTPSAAAPQPSTSSPSPSSATPPSSAAPAPSSTATPPSSAAPAPSSTTTPPSSAAPAPSSTTTPPSPAVPPPTSTTTPPSTTATPPSPSNSATSLGFGGVSAGFLSIVVAFLF